MGTRSSSFGTIATRTATSARNAQGKPTVSYRARYTGPDMAKVSQTFSRKDAARAWLVAEKALIDAGTWTPPSQRKAEALAAERRAAASTVTAWAETYLADRELRHTTEREYRRLLNTSLAPLRSKRIDQLTREDIRDWRDSLDPSKPAVAAAAYRFLRSLLKAAEDEGLIDRNPANLRNAGSVRPAHVTVPATLDELDALSDAMPKRLRLLVDLAAWVGMREGELLELRRSDFLRDSDGSLSGLVSVARAVSKDANRDHPDACPCGRVIGPTKTAAGVRTVAIPPHLLPDLRRHLLEHAAPGDDGLLFPGERKDHMSVRYLLQAFSKARDAAGRPDLHIHDLRHTALTMAGQTGATAAELKHRAGHSSSIAMAIYQHGTLARDAAIADRLSDVYTAHAEKKAGK